MEVTAKALRKAGFPSESAPEWPGFKFTYTPRLVGSNMNKAYEAMLGTPNVSGAAWMLVQHYEALGRKTIGDITVFTSEGEFPGLCILIELVEK